MSVGFWSCRSCSLGYLAAFLHFRAYFRVCVLRSHFGSSCGLAGLPFILVHNMAQLSASSASPIAELHGQVLRVSSFHSGMQFQGLAQSSGELRVFTAALATQVACVGFGFRIDPTRH